MTTLLSHALVITVRTQHIACVMEPSSQPPFSGCKCNLLLSLHGETRVATKALKQLLTEGVSSCRKGTLCIDTQCETPEINQFLEDFEKVVNFSILGCGGGGQLLWSCQFDESSGMLSASALCAAQAKHIIECFGILIDMSLLDEERNLLWHSAHQSFQLAIVLACNAQDFECSQQQWDAANASIKSFFRCCANDAPPVMEI